jgi:hypothetical protein
MGPLFYRGTFHNQKSLSDVKGSASVSRGEQNDRPRFVHAAFEGQRVGEICTCNNPADNTNLVSLGMLSRYL